MDKSEVDEGADEAPTRPVSSLRSMFEGRATGKFNPPSPLARSRIDVPVHTAREVEGSGPSRGSLDLPSRPSPWSVAGPRAASPQSGTPDVSTARLRPPEASPLRRPVSMNSLSPPISPPLVTIESPNSPPKVPQGPGWGQPRPQISGATPRIGSDEASRKDQPNPTNKGQQRLSRVDMDEQTPNSALNSERLMKFSSRTVGRVQSDTSAKTKPPPPPPINRADKPKISKAADTGVRSSSLGPSTVTKLERISPFSTPPSSSDEDVKPTAHMNGRDHLPVAHSGSSRASRNILPPPPLLPNRDTKQHEVVRQESWPSRVDARSLGFASNANVPINPTEERPGLPPRRDIERQTVPRISQSPAKIGAVPHARIQSGSKHQRIPSIDRSTKQGFMPPPRRVPTPQHSQMGRTEQPDASSPSSPVSSVGFRANPIAARDQDIVDSSENKPSDYPDISRINRRPPIQSTGVRGLETDYDARVVDVCGRFVCTAGHFIRVWDSLSGQPALNLYVGEKDLKITSLAFKPGATAGEDDAVIWVGTSQGELKEVDIARQDYTQINSTAHERRAILRIHRHQNAMWTLDEGGKLCSWTGGPSGLPDLQDVPNVHKVCRGQTVSLLVQDKLWLTSGKDIRIYRPNADNEAGFALLKTPLSQPGIGAITSAAIIDDQRDRVYFGHADGKVSIYATDTFNCSNIVSLSVYKIVSLAGVGSYLWAGYNTGMIHVYDTQTQPWMTKKEWAAHHGSPVLDILVDRSSLWNSGGLRVASIGSDSAVRLWDGTLEADWVEDDMHEHDVEYCVFREMIAKVITWNAGAATPTHLRYDEDDSKVFESFLQTGSAADLLVFGFQELVDLEDKKLTAKSLFKGSMKKDPNEHEHVGRQYRAWRDYLVRCVEDCMPAEEPYTLVQTSNMVGLFSCVFVKASLRSRIRAVDTAEIKRGMGGLHGNKGALVIRIILDDSSVCLVNCHLAAGQTKTADRNNDVTAILETALLPPERDLSRSSDLYPGGGDGSLITDNEICLLNGDLNYRIDTMGRDIVVKAINADNLSKLLERDQLLVTRRRNPAFRLLSFREAPIAFAPTYKYDVGSDTYDTSEKRRAPAWCDRILYRGPGKIKQLDYRRHELRVSDHRPVSAVFKMRVKQVLPDNRERVRKEAERRFVKFTDRLAAEAKITYLRDVLGVPPNEAKRLL